MPGSLVKGQPQPGKLWRQLGVTDFLCSKKGHTARRTHLLILQPKILGNLHALEPADVAVGICSFVKGLLQRFALVQAHDMQSAPGPPGQDVGHCGRRKPSWRPPRSAGRALIWLAAVTPTDRD